MPAERLLSMRWMAQSRTAWEPPSRQTIATADPSSSVKMMICAWNVEPSPSADT